MEEAAAVTAVPGTAITSAVAGAAVAVGESSSRSKSRSRSRARSRSWLESSTALWVLNCTVDHILQEFYTLFLTRFIIYKQK